MYTPHGMLFDFSWGYKIKELSADGKKDGESGEKVDKFSQRKMFIDVEHAVKGSHGTARPSWRFERRAILPKLSGPAFGQHSEEILEELGYNSAEIEAFRDSLITTDFITRA